MLPTGNNWIPDTPPALRFRAEVPLFWKSSLDVPILHRGMVLVTCGISQCRVAAPVLAGIDALSGEQRLRVEVQLQHPREVSAGLPGTLENGRILLPVYVHDTYLKVLAIDLQGTVVAEDDLGTDAGRDVRRDLNICANDSGIKMFLAPLAVTGIPETYVVSWIYRQYVFRTQVRRLGRTSPNWSSNEWMHCLVDGVVVGETSEVPDGLLRPFQERWLIGRDVRTGELQWRINAQGATFVAAGVGVFFVANCRFRDEDAAVRDDAICDLPQFEDEMSDEKFSALFDQLRTERPLRSRSVVTCHSAKTGDKVWGISIPGDVASFIAGSESFGMVLTEEDGTSRLVVGDTGGRKFKSFPFATGRKYFRWPRDERNWLLRPDPDYWPTLLAIDGDKLVWGDDEFLVCVSATSPHVEKWRIPKPGNACRSFRPQSIDRTVSTQSIAVRPDLIAFRMGPELCCFGW